LNRLHRMPARESNRRTSGATRRARARATSLNSLRRKAFRARGLPGRAASNRRASWFLRRGPAHLLTRYARVIRPTASAASF